MGGEVATAPRKRRKVAEIPIQAKRRRLSDRDVSDDTDEAEAVDTDRNCPVALPTPAASTAGKGREKKYRCTFDGCEKAFTRPCRLEEHIRSHTKERIFTCPYDECTKDFLRDTHLKHHIKSAHENQRDFACEWDNCGKAFATSSRLQRHMLAHQEKIQCTKYPPCVEVFRKHTTLQRHIRSAHLNLKPFPCMHTNEATGAPCPESFDTTSKLRAHERRTHGGLRFFCTICTPEDVGLIGLSDEPGDVVGFATQSQLQEHMKEVHPPICPHCKFQFSSLSALRDHEVSHHSGLPVAARKLFPCDHPNCTASYTRKSNLAVHVRNAHGSRNTTLKNLRYICGQSDVSKSRKVPPWDGHDACGERFAFQCQLEQHIRTEHLGIEPYIRSRDKNDRTLAAREVWRQRRTLQKLTGQKGSSDEGERIPCPVMGCVFQFAPTDEGLGQHLQSFHQWNDVDIGEALVEQQALAGGDFWLGGLPHPSEHVGRRHDESMDHEVEEHNYDYDYDYDETAAALLADPLLADFAMGEY